jgi:putative aminopeptidase FrvX
MNSVNLPAALQRRLEGGFDPTVIFRELAEIPSVSFSEYLMYRHLAAQFTQLREDTPAADKEKLSVKYSPTGQLHVAWHNRPGDPRKTILVAHVDHEGFLVREFDRQAGRALCWYTAAETPEDHVLGRRVKLLCDDVEIAGVIANIQANSGALSAEHPFDHDVEIRIDTVVAAKEPHVVNNDYFVGFGQYDLPACVERDGVIAARSVDDTAGLSVLVAVMTAAVRHRWNVNLECLFTTCEEAGFCGVVGEILRGDAFDHEKGEVVCIVVDSSSHLAFKKNQPLWGAMPADEPPKSGPRDEISLEEPVIRTGDAASRFDRDVARLLRAAAANLEGAVDRNWIPSRPTLGLSDSLRNPLEPRLRPRSTLRSKNRRRALIGRLVGGWCEATPLVLANALRQRTGRAPSLRLRVGSIAIPIGSYRNSFKNELQPEKCHEDALRGACQIVAEAVRVCHRWSFDDTDEHEGVPHNTEHLLDLLLEWQARFDGLSSVIRASMFTNA